MRNKKRQRTQHVQIDELVLPRHLAGRPHLASLIGAELERHLAVQPFGTERIDAIEVTHHGARPGTPDHRAAEQIASSIAGRIAGGER
jgi:hypothetical protein